MASKRSPTTDNVAVMNAPARLDAHRLHGEVQTDAGDGRGGIDIPPQQQRHDAAQNVAYHAAGHAGHGSHEYDDDARMAIGFHALRSRQCE